MSSRARKAAIDYAEWERVRPIIHQLYLVDGKTQRDTLKILSDYHGFSPSKAQLERKLKQWRMVRNITGPEWKYVDRVIRQRQSRGKSSQLYLSGIPLRPAAVEKARSRHCYETAIEKCKPIKAPGSSFPEDLPLIVRTPSPLEQRREDYCQVVPWLESMDFLKGLTLMMPRSRRGADNALQLLGIRLLDLVPDYVRRVLTHTARLQWTYQALCLIMPGRSREDHITRAEAVLHQADFSSPEVLETVFFLLSNGFLNELSKTSNGKSIQIINSLFELLHKSNGWAVITSQPYSQLPLSLQAILDRLFIEAVERFDLKAVQFLLQAGVDINQHFVPRGMFREYEVSWSMTPFEYAAMLCNGKATTFFEDHGADIASSSNLMNGLPHILSQSLLKNRETLPVVKLILSYFEYRPELEQSIRRVLHQLEKFGKSPVPEALIEYFGGKVVAAESISQLIVTAIRTESTSVPGLLLQYPEHFDEPNLYGDRPLTAAASQGNVRVCEELLRLGASLEVKPKRLIPFNIPTPLQCAAYYADARTVRCFLNAGAQINFEQSTDALHIPQPGSLCFRQRLKLADHYVSLSSVGRTALQAALLGRNKDTAQLLLAEGAVLLGEELAISIRTGLSKLVNPSWNSQAPSTYKTASSGLLASTLEAAIIAGDHEMAARELNESPLSVTPEALYAAVWFTNLKSASGIAFVRRILEQGAGLQHSTDHWVGTAMSLAAALDSIEVVELMLSSGLRPKSSLPRTKAYLFEPIWQKRSDPGTSQTEEVYLEWLSAVFVQYDDGEGIWPILDEAAYQGRHDYLDLLLSHGYEPTTSCAVRAARRRTSTSVTTLQFLDSRGFKMTQYVLSGSILWDDMASIEWLLSMELDLNEEAKQVGKTSFGLFERTAVQAAAEKGDLALLDKLVSLGADINAPAYYKQGATTLQVAAIQGYFEIVQRLLGLSADPNADGAKLFGRTALEGAAEHGRLDIAKLLLNSGVETIGPGRRQFVRAIAFAKSEGHTAVATLLKSHRPWTEADQEIFDEDRLLHGDQTSQKEPDRQSLDQNVENSTELRSDAICCNPHELYEEPIPSSTSEPSELLGQTGNGRTPGFVTERDDQTHSDDGYIESDMESLGVVHGEAELLGMPATQESLGEAENAFRPSGIFDQVKKDLESTGEGDGIWTEAYDAFSQEIIY